MPIASMPLEVVLVEDEQAVRDGLAILINGAPDLRCAASYRSMEEAIAGLASSRPAVILTDLQLPGVSGIDGIRVLHERWPEPVARGVRIREKPFRTTLAHRLTSAHDAATICRRD